MGASPPCPGIHANQRPRRDRHLHRLRALVDAVVVGAGTVRADDPQLTVRHVAGPNPVRVVIDPRGTLPATSPRLRRRRRAPHRDHAQRVPGSIDGGVETIALPDTDGLFAPAAILEALSARGLRRVLIEGGAQTVSSFLSAGCLDRLHVVVAPVILGAGVAGLALPPIADMNRRCGCPCPSAAGRRVLFDCDLSPASGEASSSRGKLRAGVCPRRQAAPPQRARRPPAHGEDVVVDQLTQRRASAAISPGGTSRPAEAGTVCGIAPPVVPMTGRPWAIASAKAMP